MNKNEFKKLQDKWYQILEEFGFKDAERVQGDKLVFKQNAADPLRQTNPFERFFHAEYFRLLAQKAYSETTVFRNAVDMYIVQRHADGASFKSIKEELASEKIVKSRHTIRYIIRRYANAWGVRYYTPRQLNKSSAFKK